MKNVAYIMPWYRTPVLPCEYTNAKCIDNPTYHIFMLDIYTEPLGAMIENTKKLLWIKFVSHLRSCSKASPGAGVAHSV
jgi:hypothetical protein